MKSFTVALLLVVPLVALAPAAQADHSGVTVPWTELFPPVPTEQTAEDASARCGEEGVRCLLRLERRLARLERGWGCDHRAVFATAYRLLTRQARLALERDSTIFDDPARLGYHAELFAELYFQWVAENNAGRPLPPAWQIAMDAAQNGDHNAVQDVLLAINAHVQRDQPFALAAVGLMLPDGRSGKPDHDRFNVILSRAYDTIAPEVGRRYDPMVSIADGGPSPLDDLTGTQLLALWREGGWRNAERLVNARDEQERQQVIESIELNAQLWAQSIAAFEQPGYRASRDAYCASRQLP